MNNKGLTIYSIIATILMLVMGFLYLGQKQLADDRLDMAVGFAKRWEVSMLVTYYMIDSESKDQFKEYFKMFTILFDEYKEYKEVLEGKDE